MESFLGCNESTLSLLKYSTLTSDKESSSDQSCDFYENSYVDEDDDNNYSSADLTLEWGDNPHW